MRILFNKFLRLFCIFLIYSVFVGCSTMTKIDETRIIDSSDPFESSNRAVFSFNERLDEYLMKPLASKYTTFTPKPVRSGVTNFFNNIEYINVILSTSLQGKLDQSISDVFRFLFNSTLGVAGLFDVAPPMGFKTHREDLGQTFAVWGVTQGPYLTLPALGPRTTRDMPSLVSNYFLNPLNYISTTVALPATFLNIINKRANFLNLTSLRDSAAIDAYLFTREAYLQSRRSLIYDGDPPPEDDFDDIFELDLEDNTL